MTTTTKTPKTKTIRIAVAIDADGNWSAAGGSHLSAREAMELNVNDAELIGTHQQYYLTVTIPLPRPTELTAAAVEAGELVEEAAA